MGYISKTKEGMVKAHRADPNFNRWKGWVGLVTARLPSATADYIVEKLLVAQWLPHYHLKWLIQDAIAGVTVGVRHVYPQGLAYAKIATIPVEYGLCSCSDPVGVVLFPQDLEGYVWVFQYTTDT